MPSTNAAYWSAKIGRNHERDVDTTRQLEQRGWLVLRFWEHESPADVAGVIADAVRRRRITGSA